MITRTAAYHNVNRIIIAELDTLGDTHGTCTCRHVEMGYKMLIKLSRCCISL